MSTLAVYRIDMPREYERLSIVDRFWGKVEKTADCWLWTGAKTNDGYGYLGRTPASKRGPAVPSVRAHRLSWELHNDRAVPDGFCVCHRCDNPPCVNPEHLFLGTVRDNNEDRNQKGRDGHFKGAQNPNAKLDALTVRGVRALYDAGWSQQKIADLFGIVQPHVSRIIRGESWDE